MRNKEKHNEYNRKSYYKHRAARLAQQKQKRDAGQLKNYYKLNPDKYKNTMLLSSFGITLDQYKSMQQAQNNLCAICKLPEKSKSLAVDHCHKTGKVRGLLCQLCNRALGMFKDDLAIIENVLGYLKS